MHLLQLLPDFFCRPQVADVMYLTIVQQWDRAASGYCIVFLPLCNVILVAATGCWLDRSTRAVAPEFNSLEGGAHLQLPPRIIVPVEWLDVRCQWLHFKELQLHSQFICELVI